MLAGRCVYPASPRSSGAARGVEWKLAQIQSSITGSVQHSYGVGMAALDPGSRALDPGTRADPFRRFAIPKHLSQKSPLVAEGGIQNGCGNDLLLF